MTDLARTRVLGCTMATLGLGCLGQPPADDVPTGADVGETVAALDSTRPVSVRFINIAASCSPLSFSEINRALALTNEVFGEAGLSFRFYSYESYPLPATSRTRDVKGNPVTWDEIPEVWQGLGISCPSCSTEGEKHIEDWLFRISQQFLPRQYIMWLGCGSGGVAPLGYPTAFIHPAPSAPHEVGHSFGLPHTFEVPRDCTFWDLVYTAQGSGKSNFYFSSRQNCISRTIGAPVLPGQPLPSLTFYKIDPRDPKADVDPENNGMPRQTSGRIVTVHNPRCSGCTTDFGVPSPDVEEYSTGASQIAGFARFNAGGAGAINAMTYCSSTGCPSSGSLGAEYFSASQIAVVQTNVASHSWVQSDETCSTGIDGGTVCCAASCGTCGGAGCTTRPGGSAACCAGTILNAGFSCTQTGPPCIKSDPQCVTGIDGGTVCCAPGCGTCGGAGCNNRPGGSAACCAGTITNAGRSCSTNMPPCVLP